MAGVMFRPIASRSFPATPSHLANIRDFVKSACSDGSEHVALLANEIASLLLHATPSMTIALTDHGDRLGVDVKVDAIRERTTLGPGELARRVMEGLTDELVIDLDDLVVTAQIPIHHPVYAG